MTIQTLNPSTGELLQSFDELSNDDLESTLNQAHKAFLAWRRTSLEQRVGLMNAAADVLETNAPEYARLMATEMGKPVRQGRSEIEKSAGVCRYYAEHAPEFLEPEPIETEAHRSFVTFPPLGVVLAVMPWNFPFWQVFRFAAPALMAGNAAVLKHAANVPQCAQAIEDVFSQAGFPLRVFTNLFIGKDTGGERDPAPRDRGGDADGQYGGRKSGREHRRRRLEEDGLGVGR